MDSIMKYLTLLLTLIAFSVNAQSINFDTAATTRPLIISGGYISNPVPVDMPYYTADSFKIKPGSITLTPIVMYNTVESDTIKAMVLECTWGSNEVRPVSLYRIRKVRSSQFFSMSYNSTSYYYNTDFSPYIPPKNTFLFLPDNK